MSCVCRPPFRIIEFRGELGLGPVVSYSQLRAFVGTASHERDRPLGVGRRDVCGDRGGAYSTCPHRGQVGWPRQVARGRKPVESAPCTSISAIRPAPRTISRAIPWRCGPVTCGTGAIPAYCSPTDSRATSGNHHLDSAPNGAGRCAFTAGSGPRAIRLPGWNCHRQRGRGSCNHMREARMNDTEPQAARGRVHRSFTMSRDGSSPDRP
jgi:hypothetical protein